MENIDIVLGVAMFTLVVLALVVIILVAKSKLVASGDITISIKKNTIGILITFPLLSCHNIL